MGYLKQETHIYRVHYKSKSMSAAGVKTADHINALNIPEKEFRLTILKEHLRFNRRITKIEKLKDK